MSTIGDELRNMVRAGWRLLALETFEEDRAQGLLERVAQALERKFVVWSCASGLGGDESAAGTLEAGLRAIEQVSHPVSCGHAGTVHHVGATSQMRQARVDGLDVEQPFHPAKPSLAALEEATSAGGVAAVSQ